jgi:hypothetical protein
MAKEISGLAMLTTLFATEKARKTTTPKRTLDSNHALHQSLIGKREGIRLPAKKPQDHVNVLLTEGSRK